MDRVDADTSWRSVGDIDMSYPYIRFLWAVIMIPLILYYIPSPWSWCWVAVIIVLWVLTGMVQLYKAYHLALKNHD